jgi:alpha-galactosidase
MTNEESEAKYRAYLQTARNAIGEEIFWLLSWGVMTEGAGLVDACRISMDALPTWSGLRMQIMESARWWHTHRILWQNDPDHVCMRAKLEWVRSVISLVSLSGQPLMLSDSIDKYNDELIYMIQRTLPPLLTVPGETGSLDTDYTAFTWTKFHGFGVLNDPPYRAEVMDEQQARDMAGWSATMNDNHPFGSLWAFHIETAAGRWCVVYRVAVSPLRESEVPLEAFGLGEGEYLTFDFWKQRFLGRIRNSIRFEPLELGNCQVIAIRRAKNQPQLISSSRHISQDAVSVLGQSWKDKELVLILKGIAGTKETYWLHLPDGFNVDNVYGEGLSANIGVKTDEEKGQVLDIEVNFKKEQAKLLVRMFQD